MSLLARSGLLTCAVRGCCGLGVFLLPVRAADGTIAAHAVDALASCGGRRDRLFGRLYRWRRSYFRYAPSIAVVRSFRVHNGAILTKRPASEFRALAEAKAA